VNEGGNFLSEVSLQDVRLAQDSVYGRAQQTNLEYLLLLDVDRLVWNFRKQAGLAASGTPYGGWEGADVELRGHFVGMLYLSWEGCHDGLNCQKPWKQADFHCLTNEVGN
jgi:Beta-L-arabinofuranosidase, GH127